MKFTEAMFIAERESFYLGESREDMYAAMTSYGVGKAEQDWDE